jgi:hypothetical protein
VNTRLRNLLQDTVLLIERHRAAFIQNCEDAGLDKSFLKSLSRLVEFIASCFCKPHGGLRKDHRAGPRPSNTSFAIAGPTRSLAK